MPGSGTDLDWYSAKMLDLYPDLESMNLDPQYW
jgi:hypothetical protein